MSEPVKGQPRRYDASRRQEQARQNRAAVLAAARTRFLGQGYAPTTVAEIARDAGVSVETVYKTFTNKAGILKAVFDVTLAGDDEPVPIAERDLVRSVIEEPDPRRKVARYFRGSEGPIVRTAPVTLLVRDAAASDPGAADVWAKMRAEMLDGMGQFAANLHATGTLRVSESEARDLLFTYHSVELYELLVLARGWSTARYLEHVIAALQAALFGPE